MNFQQWESLYSLKAQQNTVMPPSVWEVVDFNAKLRKILNAGNLTVRLLTWDN
jgi:hypothetical protein